ncbi:tetratricopeptide repeat protein [Sphingomonas solaris]|uniref:Tetratricopeptide repeat protein n=1 Tax=Alterirhizorhabdus solaris TaxID=2529389 RepID=A0A558R0S6_9SPHN|nr:tetratricopeptide repeat protein [Sphingomonas solaris]TVV73005.1 tetratricopeptide repeat protein [Sphingomonas solaris]
MKPFALALFALVTLAPPPVWAKPPATEAPRRDPDEARLQEALVLIASGRVTEAMPLLDRIVTAKTKEYAGEKRRIYCARSMAETLAYMTMAAAAREDAVAMPPVLADAIFYKGFVLVDLHRDDEAEAAFRRAITLSPSHARYLAELGELYKRRRDWPTALATFQRADEAAALSPDDHRVFEQTRAWRGIGFVMIEQGRLEEAQGWFEKSLALDPNDAKARAEIDYIRQQRAKAAPPA